MSNSPNLSLPYILPSQAQKHVTHNLAIELLDALVQLSVTDLAASVPPPAPFEGQVVVVGSEAQGEFTRQEGKIACFGNGGWMFIPPRNGFKAWVESDSAFYVHQDGVWHMLLTPGTDRAAGLGLNADWDFQNRLSVASPATLLSHEGAGHQLKINKAAATETGTLLFQTGFSGRAEMGLAGGEDFSVKVSADGTEWTTALSVDAANGTMTTGRIDAESVGGEAVQSSPDDTTPGRLMRADWGYGPGNVLGEASTDNGKVTGALFERGSNEHGSYVRSADGRVEIVKQVLVDTTTGGTQSFPLPTDLIPSAHPVSLSNVGSSPNPAIRLNNIRLSRVVGSNLQLRLDNTFPASTDANNDTLICLINGYWF